jgi:hypothetical protein
MAGGVSSLDSIFMPGTTVEIMIIVFVPDWSMMVLTQVGPVVVMVVTREDVPAVGGTAAGTVVSILAGVSGTESVGYTEVRPCNLSILLRSSLLRYLKVCFIRGIGWVSLVAVVVVGPIASVFGDSDDFRWASAHSR